MALEDEMKDRYRAVLLGCAIGDSLGMSVEGWKKEQIRKYVKIYHPEFQVGKITDLIDPIIVRDKNGTIIEEDEFGKLKYYTKDLKKGEWTDDTILTLALAESIVEMKGLSLEDIAKRQLREYQIRKRPDGTIIGGFGKTTMDAFKNLEKGISPFNSGVIGGPGNAPGMKMHPIGMYMHASGELELGLEYAKLTGKITHLDPRSITSGEIQAVAIYNLLNDFNREDFLSSMRETCRTHEKPLEEKFTWHNSGTLLKRIEWIYDNRDKQAEEAFNELGASSAVYQSYPFAVFMFQKFWDKPLEGLIEIVNYGGDCDTTGAIYGALAGAKNGTAIFPADWINNIHQKERIIKLADGIYNLGKEQV